MQRKIGTEIELGKTVSPYDSIGASSTIVRTGSNYTDAGDEVRKIRKLIETGTYDNDIARHIPGTLDLVFQGMLEDIDKKRTTRALFIQGHGEPRFSNSADRQLLHKHQQHAPVLPYEN